jgi:hypothetical protein
MDENEELHEWQNVDGHLKYEKKPNVVSLIPTKSDADYAKELKARSIEAWKPLLEIMQEANSNGFRIVINAGMNELGQAFIHNLEIQKIYK